MRLAVLLAPRPEGIPGQALPARIRLSAEQRTASASRSLRRGWAWQFASAMSGLSRRNWLFLASASTGSVPANVFSLPDWVSPPTPRTSEPVPCAVSRYPRPRPQCLPVLAVDRVEQAERCCDLRHKERHRPRRALSTGVAADAVERYQQGEILRHELGEPPTGDLGALLVGDHVELLLDRLVYPVERISPASRSLRTGSCRKGFEVWRQRHAAHRAR